MKRNTLTNGPKRQVHGSCLYIHVDVWASEAETRVECVYSSARSQASEAETAFPLPRC